ncbi:lipopolysaccharide kinase InaA family protein [Aliarcobacter skirrowii]|uniref:lipopolysaccharide kinase InaA family protein n=1 Tax=Aliarcobacter skirrowii TaxID=28200 RepID=UPI0021B17D6B|nr:lipopolysaccharide kinase InaA family protein [Aliarcobacter skirrowii]MCT7447126.1 hypothetical protein [Aliarcobacter skirrowii]
MLNYKYKVNNGYYDFFVLNIRTFFRNSKNSIHKARNEIKVINYENKDLVVKAFKRPHFLNRIIYSFFRESKAKRTYEYALKIGEFTPKPIGYIEFYENLLLKDSYFISEKFEYTYTIREPLFKKDFPRKEEILKSFAKFAYTLHNNGIYHLDFSPGNILIKEENDEFIFKIVDINRMKFLNMNLNLRMKSFSKLWAKENDLKIIAKEYAKILQIEDKTVIEKIIYFTKKDKKIKNMKNMLRGKR